jgi:hypothetical protein
MAEEPDSILLQYMRRFDAQLQRMCEDIQSIIHRRLDRMDERLERIERRLELVGSPYGGVRE